MKTTEVIEAYFDDLLYLDAARSALLTHPLRRESKWYCDMETCRLLAVRMIDCMEVILETWRDRQPGGVLDAYFAERNTNGARVTSLCEAFHNAGIPVDRQVFDDYLAIKYLRNSIVHGRWKENEKEWLDRQGFPTDCRKLTKEHLDRINNVHLNMFWYALLAVKEAPAAAKPEKLIKLDETVTRRAEETGILGRGDIDRIIWNNLERIADYIYADIERVATSPAYDWSAGLGPAVVIAPAERKRLIYLAARRAGQENHELLVRHRALAAEALEFWHDYWQRALASRGLDETRIDQALAVLHNHDFVRIATEAEGRWWPPLPDMPEEEAQLLVDPLLKSGAPFTSGQVVSAFKAGHLAHQVVPGGMPVELFMRLAIVDPANTAMYHREADRALRAYRLNRAWYFWVEHRRPPAGGELELLDSYERTVQALAGKPPGT